MYGASPYANQAQAMAVDVKPPLLLLTLPDDHPNPMQVKMGPLGQILKGGPSGGLPKKKAKLLGAGGPGMEGLVNGLPGEPAPPKKKKGATGVGTGNGRKKKLADALAQAQAQGQNGQGQGPTLPAVIVASA